MRAPTVRATRGQLLLRAVVAAGPVAALLATALVGPAPAVWLLLLTAVLAVGFAVRPESLVGAAAYLVVLAWWGISMRDGLHAEALLAAAALVASHVAAVVTSYGPVDLPVERRVLGRWVRRGLLVLLPAVAVWALADTVREDPEQPGIWIAGLVVALAAAVAGAVVGGTRPRSGR